ncbi:disease resistance protein RGA5-like [Miscanthus floridulus]|uniref:disease resistance protein RGA5-like n=1 Tax=Miscanthus floridulus TaxID=154761 RepID=UPI003458F5A4
MGARVYQMGALGKDSSRKLLLVEVHSKPQSSPDYIERILAKCDGSPLALKAVSGLIKDQKHIIQWNELYNTMTKFGLDSSNKIQMMRVDISHSYVDLPYHKRDCLLYLSLLPNDEIDRKCLVSRWVAEGLVADETDGKKMFRDLVNRNLILPPVIKYDGDASTYKVHPTVHDFTVWKAVEYNFITLPNATGQSRGKVRRISVHKNTEGAGDINLKEVDTSHLRSFSMSGPGQLPEKMSSSVLRLLVLEKCKNDGTVLWKPFQPNLKHLKLEEGLESYDAPPFVRGFMDLVPNTTGAIGSDTIADFRNIIKGLARIENAKNLRTMDVRGLGGVKLEEAVTKLHRLACLLVHQECTLPNGIEEMESSEELQTIGLSNHNMEFLRKLGELPKLRTMGIYLT